MRTGRRPVVCAIVPPVCGTLSMLVNSRSLDGFHGALARERLCENS